MSNSFYVMLSKLLSLAALVSTAALAADNKHITPRGSIPPNVIAGFIYQCGLHNIDSEDGFKKCVRNLEAKYLAGEIAPYESSKE